jgi:hypothetical protein
VAPRAGGRPAARARRHDRLRGRPGRIRQLLRAQHRIQARARDQPAGAPRPGSSANRRRVTLKGEAGLKRPSRQTPAPDRREASLAAIESPTRSRAVASILVVEVDPLTRCLGHQTSSPRWAAAARRTPPAAAGTGRGGRRRSRRPLRSARQTAQSPGRAAASRRDCEAAFSATPAAPILWAPGRFGRNRCWRAGRAESGYPSRSVAQRWMRLASGELAPRPAT